MVPLPSTTKLIYGSKARTPEERWEHERLREYHRDLYAAGESLQRLAWTEIFAMRDLHRFITHDELNRAARPTLRQQLDGSFVRFDVGPDEKEQDIIVYGRLASVEGTKVGPWEMDLHPPSSMFVGLDQPPPEYVSHVYPTRMLLYLVKVAGVAEAVTQEQAEANDGAATVLLVQQLFGVTKRFAVVDQDGKYVAWMHSKAPGEVRQDVAVYLDASGKWQYCSAGDDDG